MTGGPTDFPLERLRPWLEENVPGFQGLLSIDAFSGGQSNPTYRVTAESGEYVLRRTPFGELMASAHAVDREHRLMTALHPAGFPVPRPDALCMDASIIGARFCVMAYVPGRIFWNGALPGLAPTDRDAIYRQLFETLADLHAVDPEKVGLGDFGRTGNYFERQVARWIRQYRAAQTETVPEIEQLMAWLQRTIPPQGRTTIVHGDYRIDNVIFALDRPEVRAVMDWELATLGDPVADLSYLILNWHLPPVGDAGLAGLDLHALGIPPADEMAAHYFARADVEPPAALDWYLAFGMFRLIGIIQGIKKRSLEGTASSARAGDAIAKLEPFTQIAWQIARAAGA